MRGPELTKRVRPASVSGSDLDALIRSAQSGDRAAFDEIVRRTYGDVYALALRLTGNPDDARDVTQDVYLRAYRGVKRFRGDAQISTWLYRITANCSSTLLGRRTRQRHEVLHDDAVVVDGYDDHDPVLAAEGSCLRAELEAGLRRLPERLRAVVILRDAYDLSHEAIATELGISETAAKVRLHRARRRLRELIFPAPADEGSEQSVAV